MSRLSMFMRGRAWRCFLVAALASQLPACGGGGSSSNNSGGGVAQGFSIGGTLSGLAGGQQVGLLNNAGDALTLSSNGAFTFATPVAANGSYSVSVGSQPVGQTCSVTPGTASGSGVAADVGTVAVVCATNTYAIGGTLSGLAGGQQVLLRNNGGDDLLLAADGAFGFARPVTYLGSYNVTVASQPPGQTCSVTQGAGAGVTAAVGSVGVVCSGLSYPVGGSVTGLGAGQQVSLLNNGADALTVSANGTFSFAQPVAYDGAYAVTVSSQSSGLTCTVTAGTGSHLTAAVGNVAVACQPLSAGPDVYVAGWQIGNNTSGYWKNGVFTAVPGCGAAWAIQVVGTDVYVAGTDLATALPAVWKNSVETLLPLSAGVSSGKAYSVAVSGADVYVAGYEGVGGNSAPKLWKNGVAQALAQPVMGGDQAAYAVAVSGVDVYVAGRSQASLAAGVLTATIWKNGVASYLPRGNDVALTALAVSGNDVYAAGADNATLISNGRYYWKNGQAQTLSVPQYGYTCTGIGATSAGDVLIAGTYGNAPAYWQNGQLNALAPVPNLYSKSGGMAIQGNDVYMTGNYGDFNGAGYWKNGVWTLLADAQTVNVIVVQ